MGASSPRTQWRGRFANDEYHVCVLTRIDLDRLIRDTETTILDVIRSAEDERTAGLYAMVRYHLGLDSDAPRGKRIRPLIGLLAYQSIAGDHARALPGAAAVEMGHNFSLVHDDIEDHGLERRHRPALWTVAGVPQAINTGDALFTLSRIALHRLSDEGFDDARVLRLMRLYDETCLALCEGQFMDIWSSEHDEWLSVDWYFDMIGRKTAALIAGAAEAGAILATEDEAVITSYRSFGWSLGLAFQLNDDLLGIWGDTAVTGKETSDIATRKKTLPLIYALERARGADARRLREILARSDQPASDAEVEEVRAILERVGARDYTREQARRHRDEALSHIAAARIMDGEAIERLARIAEAAISA
jgi:geranylgeranyl diphosphate synthase, type I